MSLTIVVCFGNGPRGAAYSIKEELELGHVGAQGEVQRAKSKPKGQEKAPEGR